MPVKLSQAQIDVQNADFWNELCGTNMARTVGISEPSAESLRKFDTAYFTYYPYLERYVSSEDLLGKRVLEVGLGYGTLGQLLASRGCQYYGLDIANNPVAIMRYRLSLLGETGLEERVQQGSALEIPFSDASFDYVYSIGCLHHTGNLSRAISEVYRVLSPGGRAVVMLYNKYSLRQLIGLPSVAALRIGRMARGAVRVGQGWTRIQGIYDANEAGELPPHTEYISRAQVRVLFRRFASLSIESQNCDHIALRGRIYFPRERLLGNVGRLLGLDLYIVARK
jgi:SAM-dependent methyltransferase